MQLSLVFRPYLKRSLSSSNAQKVLKINPFRLEIMWSNFCSKNLQVIIMGSFFLTTVRSNYFTYTQINVYDLQDIDKLVFFLAPFIHKREHCTQNNYRRMLGGFECIIATTYNKVCSAESKQYPVQTKNFILMTCKPLVIHCKNMYA